MPMRLMIERSASCEPSPAPRPARSSVAALEHVDAPAGRAQQMRGEHAAERAADDECAPGHERSLAAGAAHTSSGHGTMVDFTVFIAIASATASATPSSVKG